MGKPRKKHPEEDSIFANNPFIEGLFEWMDSPEGEKHLEIYDALSKLMEDVHLDARERKVIWPDAERLDIEQTVQRIQKLYRDFPRDEIEEFIVDWIDMGYEPEKLPGSIRRTRQPHRAMGGRPSPEGQDLKKTEENSLLLSKRGKRPTIVATAIARELCGFIWAIHRAVTAPGGRQLAS